MTGALGAFAAIGHMTVPSLAGAAIDRHGYAALMPLLCALNGIGLALLTAVARRRTATLPAPPHSLHLRANFHADEGSGGAVPQGGRRLGGRSKRAEEARRDAAEMQRDAAEMQRDAAEMQPSLPDLGWLRRGHRPGPARPQARRIASEWSPSPRGNSALDGGSSSGEDWAEAGQGERQRLLGGASRRGSAPTTGTVVV